MGLTRNGFVADSYQTIADRITARLVAFDPDIDLSVESIEGQHLRIFSYEVSLVQAEQKKTHYSYSPLVADGLGLQNLGLISGYQYGVGQRSAANILLGGTADTPVPKGSIVTDSVGNEFATSLDAVVGANVQVVAKLAGAIAMPIGTVDTIQTAIPGWTSIDQAAEGIVGSSAQTEEAFRNIRNKTVLRNYTSVVSVIESRLVELGIVQVNIVDNKSLSTLPDGTPAGAIHVTIGEVGAITDEQIAQTILATLNTGTPTYGTTNVVLEDSQGTSITINFDKATAINIEMTIDVTYLSEDTAGAEEGIKADVAAIVNGLLAGGDVIHSHLYAPVTKHAQAQINSLTIGEVGQANQVAANFEIGADEFALVALTDITVS